MTHHPIKTLADGTRVYSNYTKYKPKKPEERTYAIRKPADPRAVRWLGDWLLPLDLLEDSQRELPETRPDSFAYDHMFYAKVCYCDVCHREQAEEWKTRWCRDHPGHPRTIQEKRIRRKRRKRERRQMRKLASPSTSS